MTCAGFVGLLLTGSLLAAAPNIQSKLSPELRTKSPGQEVDVIVRWKNSSRDVDTQLKAKANWHRHLSVVNATAYRMQASDLAALANDQDVESVAEDHVVRGTTFNGSADYGWVTALGAAAYSSTAYDGTGIGIAVIDSGIDDDEDLKDAKGHNRIVYKESFVSGDKNTGDGYGHGSHVAGIVAGNGKRSTGKDYLYTIRGIAANANLINLRVLDKTGAGRDSDVIAAISRAIALKDIYNIRVINLSLGRGISSSCNTDVLCQAVESAWKAGIVVVVAAGNNGRDNSAGNFGYGTITAPGNSPSAITVGAMNTQGTPNRGDDRLTSYSSKGPSAIDHIAKPDLVAPGNRILSLRDSGSVLDKEHAENRVPKYIYSSKSERNADDYYQLSGTSMAAPMVSGAAALLIQQNPAITPDQVKARLMLTASKFNISTSTAVDPSSSVAYTSYYDVFTIGAGYLDIQAALSNRELADLPARSPVAMYDAQTGAVFLADDPNAVWDNRSRWGLSTVWGMGTLSASRSVWKLDNSLDGARSVWGVSLLGASSAWGTPSAAGFQPIWSSSVRPGSIQTAVESLSVALDGEN